MFGAILGDIIGAPYEFDRGDKTKEFPLFSKYSEFTDDSVMTIAVADALLSLDGTEDDNTVREALICSMRKWGGKYPDAGYGSMFINWLFSRDPKPYGSFGNGSAMRVSSVGWLFDTLEETRRYAKLSAEVSHNHPEGIKGAEAIASAIFMARNGASKEEIKEYIIREFGYDLSRTCDEIRPGYYHIETCQKTVPEAITAFMEGSDFEDVIRTAVSLGGDCDTLTCIAGGMAEAFYGMPEELKNECWNRVPDDMREVLDRFDERRMEKEPEIRDPFLAGNEMIEEAIQAYEADRNEKAVIRVLEAIRTRMHADGHFIFPVEYDPEDRNSFAFRTIQTDDKKIWFAAFTSNREYKKGAPSEVISYFIDQAMKFSLSSEADGILINPFGQAFALPKDLMNIIFKLDGDQEYAVPDDPITPELLEDGSFLKKATEICSRNRTNLNLFKVMHILRDSHVWIPCHAVMSDEDYAEIEKAVNAAEKGEGLDSLKGHQFQTKDVIRMVPDILQNGENFFFPVFTSAEEMGEYGKGFSKVQKHFLEACVLAKNSEKSVKGIVINAFSEPFVFPRELFEVMPTLKSSFEEKEEGGDAE